MESTWEPRDLPVLDAVVRYFEERDPMDPRIPNVGTFAEITGLPVEEVYRAVRELEPTYLSIDDWQMDDLGALEIMGVTDQARRVVGQWPSPEVWVDRLVEALREAAEREPDPEKKGRLRAMAEGLGGVARDVAVGVLSGGITQSMGSS
jgi:hypothetical protein